MLVLIARILTATVQAAPAVTDCPARNIDERVEVVYVYDGDTVKLGDGRRLRLIGINTPETGPRGEAPQPYAAEAREVLTGLLDSSNRRLGLQYGREHRDHYGRMLAHVFLEDGSNVAVRLLGAGLATTLVVAPNTWGEHCYQTLEDEARRARRGLWSLPQYQAQESADLEPLTRGFRIVTGPVTDLRRARYSLWLDLAGALSIHISRKDLVHFEAHYLERLVGHRVEVRGWIKPDKKGLRLNVRHPAALRRTRADATLEGAQVMMYTQR